MPSGIINTMSNVDFKNKLLSLFYEANSLFLAEDMDNIENGVSERNLCALLACKLNRLKDRYDLSEYFADVEYNRNGGEIKTIIDDRAEVLNVTCDLIVHSRGHKQKDNLIALEMKKVPYKIQKLDDDRRRLKALTKHDLGNVFPYNGNVFPENVCDYEIGICYIIDREKRSITLEIYDSGKLVNEETETFKYFMGFNKDEFLKR